LIIILTVWKMGRGAVLVGLGMLTLSLPACSEAAGSQRAVVASIYPLAFAAQRVAGPAWEVIDLTPPGVEAHDVELSFEDRAAIEEADLVVYLGDVGFQPQVEAAVEDARGTVLAIGEKQIIHEFEKPLPLGTDPHVWLDPGALRTTTSLVANALIEEHRAGRSGYLERAETLKSELRRLDIRYRQTLDITDCDYQVAVVPHEAFNYIVGRYAFRQYGLAGLAPEGEPTPARLAEAQRLIESGEAGAVFFEPTDEASRRTAQTLARDMGVPALPLSTLESQPPEGDYITVMEDNLDSLRRGLGCP
jgi:zinc transport system substrate-binding protein